MARTIGLAPQGDSAHVVIVGGGFAGLMVARSLRNTAVHITLIDKTNHHLFQPLLYQVATGGLSPTDISAPIRSLLQKQDNIKVIMREVTDIDRESKQVILSDGAVLPYTFLVLAPGGRHHYFAHPEWEPLAPGLKTIEDAMLARERFLGAFESAESCTDVLSRNAWLTFVVVGGGPTGCELAGVLPEIANKALAGEYRSYTPADVRIILVENSTHVLDHFPEKLQIRATADLKELGVDVIPNRKVANITEINVTLDDGTVIPTRTVFWAAGNMASPLCSRLGAKLDRSNRVYVTPALHVDGDPSCFVIGDAAHVANPDGSTVPGVAPAARQMGLIAAQNIASQVVSQGVKSGRGTPGLRPFIYKDKGSMAVLGRHKAVVSAGRVQISGTVAWLMWLFVHILYLAGYRNRLLVFLEWGYAYLTYRRGVRYLLKERK